MDLDWCLTCSQHTSGNIYCSEECRNLDIKLSAKAVLSSQYPYSLYTKPYSSSSISSSSSYYSPSSSVYNLRLTPRPSASSSSEPSPSSSPPSPANTLLLTARQSWTRGNGNNDPTVRWGNGCQ